MGQISPQKRHGVIVGFSVYLGVDGAGRRQRRFFVQRADAEKFLAERNKTPRPIGELWDRKAEILCNLERLRLLGTNLTDVVTFYISRQGPVLGDQKIADVMEQLLKDKLQVGRSPTYERNMRQCFRPFMKVIGADRKIGEVTRQQISDYVYSTKKHLSNVSKKNILTNFSVLFNYAVRRDLLGKTPVEKIDRPTIPFVKPEVMAPADFEQLLRQSRRKKWHDRLTIFVLVGFCGEALALCRNLNATLVVSTQSIPNPSSTKSTRCSRSTTGSRRRSWISS